MNCGDFIIVLLKIPIVEALEGVHTCTPLIYSSLDFWQHSVLWILMFPPTMGVNDVIYCNNSVTQE